MTKKEENPLAVKLLNGWIMCADACEKCLSPLMKKDKNSKEECVVCKEEEGAPLMFSDKPAIDNIEVVKEGLRPEESSSKEHYYEKQTEYQSIICDRIIKKMLLMSKNLEELDINSSIRTLKGIREAHKTLRAINNN
jgi:uncharacterized Zn finger protein (UPF0148 family)